MTDFLLGVVAALLGGLVGLGELVGRYRDEPMEAVKRRGWLYIALNAAASLGAFAIIRAFDWRLGVDGTGDTGALRATQLLAAGFGSMALFRASLFTVKVGDEDVGIGPSAFLTVVLNAADRAVDRKRAEKRSKEVTEIMHGVSFDKAAVPLPIYCFQVAMQNVSDQEQLAVSNVVNTLKAATDPSDKVKAFVLGAALLSVVGADVLRRGVDDLSDEIKLPTTISL